MTIAPAGLLWRREGFAAERNNQDLIPIYFSGGIFLGSLLEGEYMLDGLPPIIRS